MYVFCIHIASDSPVTYITHFSLSLTVKFAATIAVDMGLFVPLEMVPSCAELNNAMHRSLIEAFERGSSIPSGR